MNLLAIDIFHIVCKFEFFDRENLFWSQLIFLRKVCIVIKLILFLADGIMLCHGDTEEVEIRCCLIYAVQMVCNEVRKICAGYKGSMIAQNTRMSHILTIVDNFIFHYQMKHSDYLMETVPFHYIRSTMY